MNRQGDLFEWADTVCQESVCHGTLTSTEHEEQDSAVILDARPRLQAKTVAFFTALVRGYTPPYRDTQIVRLQDKRAPKVA